MKITGIGIGPGEYSIAIFASCLRSLLLLSRPVITLFRLNMLTILVEHLSNCLRVYFRKLADSAGFGVTASGKSGISAQHCGHIDNCQLDFQLLRYLVEDHNQRYLADLIAINTKEVK